MTKQIEQFLKMGAAYNTGSSDIESADADDAPFSASDVVKTHQPASDFGGKKDDSGLFIKQGHQIRSGLRRGDLFVADFGDFRLVAFTGEGVIRDAA